ncbi:hypothetical protein BOTBODRAFT_138598 [Botryobasidium botryosum FD-172 SS1]|uniref:Cytochrome c oxidase assembly factor 6 n=1 Tax=Botryobasidium botryosum (strain FD-172 SS1) TaxID=930990 RepID=A0A067MAN2_BOTB1|nr:hypothetical protein BOTBODRAFT_138598 [Botryobasidium botryosum FD-172 SS1]
MSTPVAPSREDRKRCWESRDIYFSCLDAAQVVVPGEEGTKCDAQKKAYGTDCAKSWVDYFNKRRVLAERQKATLKEVERQRLEAEAKGFRR